MKTTLSLISVLLISLLLLSIQSCSEPEGCVAKALTPDTTNYPVLVLNSPLGCETYSLGDTVPISWEYYQRTYGRVGVRYTIDGSPYEFVFPSALNQAVAARDTFWVIPDSAHFISDSVVINVYDYEGGFGESSNPFTIKQ